MANASDTSVVSRDALKRSRRVLHDRLVDEQRKLILAAADADSLPNRNALAKIADLEQVIVAVEKLLDDDRPST